MAFRIRPNDKTPDHVQSDNAVGAETTSLPGQRLLPKGVMRLLLPSSVVLWAQAPDRAIWRRAPINCLALRGGPHKLDRVMGSPGTSLKVQGLLEHIAHTVAD